MKRKLLFVIFVAVASAAAMILLAPKEPKATAVAVVQTEAVIFSEATVQTEPTEQTEQTEQTEPLSFVESLLHSMTLEEKVGQLFLARFPEENAATDAEALHLGGYILFDRDFDGESPASLRSKLTSCQTKSRIPLLFAVDEEGGSVCRISDHPAFRQSKFASPRVLYGQGGMERVLQEEAEKAELLRELGIYVNMAPVCDICDRQGAFMYSRSLGQSPEITSQFVAGAIRTMKSYGVGAVMKHFPGYGNNSDTHTGIARDSRALSELENGDLLPFFAGIEAGGGAILISHTIVEAMDLEYPASLSPTVHQYLRLAMSFDGVIITDDLSMDAISRQYGVEEAAVLAVLAGNDLLCSTEYRTQYSAVLAACRDGRISEAILDAAVRRVLTWKESLDALSVG